MSITKTRQTLVRTAQRLFAQKGFEATTMNDIAQASGKGRRTLYTYFKNKEDIYDAVIAGELELLSEKLDEVVAMDISPEQKVLRLIYTHLRLIKETVTRNGTLRAEFFRNIWRVEQARKALDHDERELYRKVLTEGCRSAKFRIDNVELVADILHYAVKGLEVPYIYGRLGGGISEADSRPIVATLVCRTLGMAPNR